VAISFSKIQNYARDDTVGWEWTLTLLAVLLRQRGSGAVYPFALAKASPRGG